MGQYYLTVNLDKKEVLMPHKLGVGLKLVEQLGSTDSTPNALFILLTCSNGYGGGDLKDNSNQMVGRWGGDKIAVVGDYAQPDDLPLMFGADKIYSLCHSYPAECPEWGCIANASSHYFDITDMLIPIMELNSWNGLKINKESEGWRSRTYTHIDGIVKPATPFPPYTTYCEEWDLQP